jgi:hypothetical protein
MSTQHFGGWSRLSQRARLATTFAIIAGLTAPASAQGPPLSTLNRELAHEAVLTGAVFSEDYAVIQFKTVVLRNLSRSDAVFRIPVDLSGRYRTSAPTGVYQIELEAARDLLPYRRANVNTRAGEEYVVDLYPVPRTGTAMTLHGDIALPDPKVDYEQFPVIDDLNLVVQYETRMRTRDAITYNGLHLLLTFDTVTVAGDTIRLDPATLVATVEHATRIDVAGKVTHTPITNSPEVELRAKERVLRITSATTSKERKF